MALQFCCGLKTDWKYQPCEWKVWSEPLYTCSNLGEKFCDSLFQGTYSRSYQSQSVGCQFWANFTSHRWSLERLLRPFCTSTQGVVGLWMRKRLGIPRTENWCKIGHASDWFVPLFTVSDIWDVRHTISDCRILQRSSARIAEAPLNWER